MGEEQGQGKGAVHTYRRGGCYQVEREGKYGGTLYYFGGWGKRLETDVEIWGRLQKQDLCF